MRKRTAAAAVALLALPALSLTAFWHRRPKPAEWTGPFSPEAYRAFLGVIGLYFGVRRMAITVKDGVLSTEGPGEPRHEHLAKLAELCAGEPRARWPEIIAQHFSPPAASEPVASAGPAAPAGAAPAAEGAHLRPSDPSDEWAAFRGMVQECFRRYGFNATVEADGVVARDAAGREQRFDAPGLERGPAELSREEWPQFIDGAFGEPLRALRGGEALAGRGYDDVRERLVVQLFDDAWLSAASFRATVYTCELPGVISALVCRLPQATFRVAPETVAGWGRSEEEVMADGVANLRGLRPAMEREVIAGGVEAMRFETRGPYAAAQALTLGDYAECGGPYGALVAVPRRELLLVCPLKAGPGAGAAYTQAAVALISRILRSEWEGHTPLSSRLYWYRAGAFADLPYEVRTGADGRPAIEFAPEGEFAAALEEMAGEEA